VEGERLSDAQAGVAESRGTIPSLSVKNRELGLGFQRGKDKRRWDSREVEIVEGEEEPEALTESTKSKVRPGTESPALEALAQSLPELDICPSPKSAGADSLLPRISNHPHHLAQAAPEVLAHQFHLSIILSCVVTPSQVDERGGER
jgi:hypothetical protein